MTTSSDFIPSSDGATTVLPGAADLQDVLPELTTPQERYDHGYKRGYMSGYAEGARQAQAEHASDLASHKASWAAAQARAGSLLAQLATATERYLELYGPREAQLTDELLGAAFELAEAVVACELRTRPDRALEVAHNVLMGLPSGPAIVRVHPDDAALLEGPARALGNAAQQVSVVPDPSVGPGGCVVTSGATTVDARLVEALQRARQALLSDDEPAATEHAGGAA